MRIVIVGAGIAGLVHAKVLHAAGFEVRVFDRAPDVGGVWSHTRCYPGLRTQNSKRTYRLAEHPMPKAYPLWPAAAQVQQYIESYVDRFGLRELIRLRTEVVAAQPDPTGGWLLTVRGATEGTWVERCEHLIVANGVFSDPAVPNYPGVELFRSAGHRLCHVTQFGNLDDARGKAVVVVGYGKSACDVAAAVSEVAASTTVVARRLLWKMPVRLANVIGYEQLELNRPGEAGFAYIDPGRFERFLHGPARGLRSGLLALIQASVIRQLRLRRLDLVPRGKFEDIAEATESLVSEGFYENIAAGKIVVHRDASITRILSSGAVELSTGVEIPAELVLCATGFHQRVPFLDTATSARLIDECGDFRLYRNVLPVGVSGLSFAGYNSSGISMLSAEIGALWTAGLLRGRLRLPPEAEQREQVARRLAWMRGRTNNHHGHGGVVTPFSIHNIDELLGDLGLKIGWRARLGEWTGTVDPHSYRKLMTTFDVATPSIAPVPVPAR